MWWAGELGFQVGFASRIFVGEEGDESHDGLGDFDIAVFPTADGSAVDGEEVGELLDTELGERSTKLECLRAVEA